jgi:hypothetical protein
MKTHKSYSLGIWNTWDLFRDKQSSHRPCSRSSLEKEADLCSNRYSTAPRRSDQTNSVAHKMHSGHTPIFDFAEWDVSLLVRKKRVSLASPLEFFSGLSGNFTKLNLNERPERRSVELLVQVAVGSFGKDEKGFSERLSKGKRSAHMIVAVIDRWYFSGASAPCSKRKKNKSKHPF